MVDKESLIKLYNQYRGGNCLCGSRESCEACTGTSLFNRLMRDIDELINGPRPKPTVEDYGRMVSFPREMLEEDK